MAITLPYPTNSSLLQFTAETVHNYSNHNTPHQRLLANDTAIKAAVDALQSDVSGIETSISSLGFQINKIQLLTGNDAGMFSATLNDQTCKFISTFTTNGWRAYPSLATYTKTNSSTCSLLVCWMARIYFLTDSNYGGQFGFLPIFKGTTDYSQSSASAIGNQGGEHNNWTDYAASPWSYHTSVTGTTVTLGMNIYSTGSCPGQNTATSWRRIVNPRFLVIELA
jgi:hypothetical protein